MKVLFLYKNNQNRAVRVIDAFQRSVLNAGHKIWTNQQTADMAIVYGCGPGHMQLIRNYAEQGKPTLIIDLGYWNRNHGLGIQTSYKVTLGPHNHPQDLIKELKCPTDRFEKYALSIHPWRSNPDGPILLAGMGKKSCVLYEYPDQSWDLWAVNEIRKHTGRKIVYRPKPSWRGCPPIDGTTYSPPEESLPHILNESWAVVNRHSNVGVDALLAGIPVFSWDGAAYYQSSHDLADIETPYLPEDRQQFFNNLSFFNWSIADIENGQCWRFFWANWLKKYRAV